MASRAGIPVVAAPRATPSRRQAEWPRAAGRRGRRPSADPVADLREHVLLEHRDEAARAVGPTHLDAGDAHQQATAESLPDARGSPISKSSTTDRRRASCPPIGLVGAAPQQGEGTRRRRSRNPGRRLVAERHAEHRQAGDQHHRAPGQGAGAEPGQQAQVVRVGGFGSRHRAGHHVGFAPGIGIAEQQPLAGAIPATPTWQAWHLPSQPSGTASTRRTVNRGCAPARRSRISGVRSVEPSSDTEQMPMSLIEAMAAARPVAATDVGDIRDMLPEEQHPFIVSPLDEAVFAQALSRLGSDAALRRELGRLNQARAREMFGFDRMSDSYRRAFVRRVWESALG